MAVVGRQCGLPHVTAALGGRTRQLASFIWSEALFVTIGGAALGALAGWLLAHLLVTTLTGVFDPPPQALSVPWPYLIVLAAAAILAVSAAGLRAQRTTRRPVIELIRDA